MIFARNGAIEPTEFGLAAPLSGGATLRADRLAEGWLRIALVPAEGFTVDRTWLVTPDDDVPWSGRDKLSLDGFDPPEIVRRSDGFGEGRLRIFLSPDGEPLALRVEQRTAHRWVPALIDRPGHAWRWSTLRSATTHHSLLGPDPSHLGLGDAGGPLDRTGRRIRCLQSDALGYDAERSDPLYKHAPFVACGNAGHVFGLLYDTMSECAFDLGAEHSNYFERYRHVEVQERGIVLHLFAGPRLRDVVERLYAATGRRAFPPRWAFGFAFTSMHHADAGNAQEVIEEFAREARRRELPISAIHFGSGYTADADGKRTVFNWNEARFPDRTAMFARLRDQGFRTVANVKPVLLETHFAYERAARGGWFVRRADGQPAVERFWGGEGASLDLSNPDAAGWWKAGITDAVLAQGFDAAWNDNNEAELWDESATVAGCGAALPAIVARPLQALLMTRATFEATRAAKPGERPHTISRAGPIGIARYGETWSGDNSTSWHTLRWNLRQGLSMSLSGMPLVGHDVGGFVGPPPTPELLVRWFQMMALHPRCVMNSWKADHGDVPNLPWMHKGMHEGVHEDAFPLVQDALRLRYRFLPLLYTLVWEGGPVIVPTAYHFDEPEAARDADSFMLGPDVLVAPVVEDGARERDVYLPGPGERWMTFDGALHEGATTVRVPAPLGTLPIFVRATAVLPLALSWPDDAPHDADHVELTGFAPDNATFVRDGVVLLDDGVSREHRPDEVVRWHFAVEPHGSELSCTASPRTHVTTRIARPE